MVNVAKRMRTLQPKLYYLRHGYGASIFPPPPAPQLTQLDLWIPEQKKQQESKELNRELDGPWWFMRKMLPRIKYYNPSLPIRVETSESPLLGLTFESDNQGSLLSLEPRKSAPITQHAVFKASWSDIKSKPQPIADGLSPQQQMPIYTRNVKVDIHGKNARSIWWWVEATTKSELAPGPSPEETEMMARLAEFREQSKKDRQLVKAGIDAIKKEKEELRRAREAAERMTSDA